MDTSLSTTDSAVLTASNLIRLLKDNKHQLVLAESCTAGLAASMIAGVPGASSVLVGSSVVYQVPTKKQWLGMSEKHFNDFDVVSGETSQAMASGILKRTSWATIAAAITGHLGPEAPPDLDGIAWASVKFRSSEHRPQQITQKLVLDQSSLPKLEPSKLRLHRQVEASRQLISLIVNALQKSH
ncbi:MAG: CinA family protein [Fuerstiella sp.]